MNEVYSKLGVVKNNRDLNKIIMVVRRGEHFLRHEPPGPAQRI